MEKAKSAIEKPPNLILDVWHRFAAFPLREPVFALEPHQQRYLIL